MTTTSKDRIQSLIDGAESLISDAYPSTVGNIATLTWPSTVVVDGSTMTVPVTSTSTGMSTAVSSTPTSDVSASPTPGSAAKSSSTTPVAAETAASTAAPAHLKTDRRLGIGLGVGITFLAVAILFGVVYFLLRRKRKTGSYLRHQPPDDDEIDSWKSGDAPWSSPNHNTRIWSENEKYAPIDHSAPHMATMASPTSAAFAAPAVMRHHTDSSSSTGNGGNPYYTPPEERAELAAVHSRSNSYERIPLNSDVAPLAFDAQQSGLSGGQRQRPPTPLLHEMMAQHGPARPIERTSPQQNSEYGHISDPHSSHTASEPLSDPFADPGEADMYYEPPIPPRSPERRHSPQVHYPSGPEISNFDFGLNQQHMRNLRNIPTAEEGRYHGVDDGWTSENMHGR